MAEEHPSELLPKEVMFLYSDIELLKTTEDQQEIDVHVDNIWTNYFQSGKYTQFFSKQCLEEVGDNHAKGSPFTADIYDKVAKEVFVLAMKGPLWMNMRNFSTGCIYKSRVSRKESDVPDDLFDKLIEELNDKNWYVISEKKGVIGSRNSDQNWKGYFIFKNYCEINAPASDAVDLVWDINRRKEYHNSFVSGKTLEKFSPHSEATHMMLKFMGSVGDVVAFQTKKLMPDGAIVMMQTAADHPLAPKKEGLPRHQINLMCTIIQPTGETTCSCTEYIQGKMSQKLLKFFTNFDWFYLFVTKNFRNIKKVLEGTKKAKIRSSTQ